MHAHAHTWPHITRTRAPITNKKHQAKQAAEECRRLVQEQELKAAHADRQHESNLRELHQRAMHHAQDCQW